MEMISSIFLLVVFAVIIAILAYRGDKHAEEIRKMKTMHKRAQAEIDSLENRLASMSTRQERHNDVEAQAARLFQEQIALKMDAMDACKAMLRESWRNH